jgi:hypothetical protein
MTHQIIRAIRGTVFGGVIAAFCQGVILSHAQDLALEQRYGKARCYASIQTLSFLKNSEYFGPFAEGETLGGFQLHPLISYQPTPYFTAQGGLFMRRYWADSQFASTLAPTFRVVFQSPWSQLLLGTLPEGSAHRLIRPLYHASQLLTAPPATGLAITWGTTSRFLHSWLDWRSLLHRARQQPEVLVGGLSAGQQLLDIHPFSFHLPLQLVVYHLGGQGIAVKSFSTWMGALGLQVTYHLPSSYFLRDIVCESYYVGNVYVKSANRPFRQGRGWLSQATLCFPPFCLQTSYWRGWDFSSENVGHPLYQSMRIVDSEAIYQERDRQLLLCQLSFKTVIGRSLAVGLHVDPYYDVRHRLLEQEAGLYIIYSPYFMLA